MIYFIIIIIISFSCSVGVVCVRFPDWCWWCSGPVDFAEAPSQMLENWCWEPKILAKMSSHYETKEPLPQDMIDKVLRACVLSFVFYLRCLMFGIIMIHDIYYCRRYSNIGLFYLRQVAYAKFDMKVHMDNGKPKFWRPSP